MTNYSDPLCRFRETIQARLGEYPTLNATRLFEEVRAAGYVGGYTQVKEYVREVRPIPPPDPVVRFETPPGLQAQVDFAEFCLPWGKRFALLVVLGYSRLMWLQFYPRQTMAVLMRGLEEAFAAFGGVPAELLFDQLKAVIIDDQREIGGKLLENSEFLRFAAHWGFRIRLESFDFSFQPSIKREQIESLHDLRFVDRKENLVLLGPPGVGKTHLAISLAIAAAQRGRRVYYSTLVDLITSLEEAQAAGQLARRLVLTHPSLLVVDEIGYLPISQVGAVLFFQLMNRRYETASTVLTSNKGFEEWGEVFGDEVMAAALIDRVLQHCHLVNIRGNSYRMREHMDLYRRLRLDVDNSAEPQDCLASQRREAGTEAKKVCNFGPPEVSGLPPALTFGRLRQLTTCDPAASVEESPTPDLNLQKKSMCSGIRTSPPHCH